MPIRSAKPDLSTPAQKAYKAYEHDLTTELDLRPATVRNYLSDVQQFMAWFEKHHHQLRLMPLQHPHSQLTVITYNMIYSGNQQRSIAILGSVATNEVRFTLCDYDIQEPRATIEAMENPFTDPPITN